MWDIYYSREHVERILRRAAATGGGISRLASMIFLFSSMVAIEKVHPLQGGIIRIKRRTDRRPSLPLVPAWQFYPMLAVEVATKLYRTLKHWLWIDALRRQVRKDPNRLAFRDTAITPVDEHDTEELALFTHSAAAQAAVDHVRKVKDLTTVKSVAWIRVNAVCGAAPSASPDRHDCRANPFTESRSAKPDQQRTTPRSGGALRCIRGTP